MKIEDGTGSSRQARVNANSQIDTFAVVEAEDKFNSKSGKTWSVTQSTTPVGANDYIFYFKNTSNNQTYVVTDVRATAAAATLLSIDAVEGTPTYAAGADLTPVNRNRGKSETITGTIKEDTNTTGLTDLGRLFPVQVEGANQLSHLRTTSNIIIPPGQAIAMESSAATAVVTTWSFSVLEDL
jgi:hypothetical protein